MSNWKPKMWDKEEDSVSMKSRKNEKRLSKEVGFQLTKGSGNQPWVSDKGDGKSDDFVFELKETKHKKISVNSRVIEKICKEAAAVGKSPVLILSAYGLPEYLPNEWAVMPVEVFTELFEVWKKCRS